ncbi:MAG: 2-oxoglutarate dehydrogenase E1 component, partial [Alphaproteobacteria bacterium]|nr:2-oxoglutarate dehydrogenase E1 component [Alphaproteobacteria bacterium]
SLLSEEAVLAYEYGYATSDPYTLDIWEAQFGDFANGAQVVIDQFISSGEAKWGRLTGLALFLPHGYEGQGPEHSSARLERFLQLCALDNMQVCVPTTPAQAFHMIRRQMLLSTRKPLVVMTPKSLLRHKLAVSNIEDFTEGSTFHRVLWDNDREDLAAADKIKRVVLCTGKVYYDLLSARREKDIKDVIIMRLEQLYPFPHSVLIEELKPYKNAEVVWCQEEPENQGAWQFVDRRIEAVLSDLGGKAKRPVYVGRAAAAAPATGLMSRHQAQQEKLVNEALEV